MDSGEIDRLKARIERLEIQVERLNAAVREINSAFGNPLGIMDYDAELGEVKRSEDHE